MISLTLKDVEDGKLTEAAQEKIRKGTRKGILSAANRLVQIIQTEIIPAETPPPDDLGTYKSAWKAVPSDEGADVYNDAPHAPVIEYGGRAENVKIGRALIDALAEWAVRKGYVGQGKGSIENRSTEREAQSFAWGLAQNMKKRGMFNRNGNAGLGIAAKAREKAPAIVREEVAAEIQAALTKG